MLEFGSALDGDWLEFGIDPCVCLLSRYCLLFILTALPAEKIRLYKIKNAIWNSVFIMFVEFLKMYMDKEFFFEDLNIP